MVTPDGLRSIKMTREEHLAIIKKANKDYYENDSPNMSDEEYDALYHDYIDKYGEEDLNFVAGNVSKGLKTFKHTANMSSLDKVKYYETDKLKKKLEKLYPVVLESKLDGLTVVAYPKDGTSMFVTRGNGVEGEILPRFPSEYCGINRSSYPIRGEAFLPKNYFERINEGRKDKFANERNAASGILRRLDDNEYINYIKFIAYDVVGLDVSEDKKIKYIHEHTCFNTIEGENIESNAEDKIESFYKRNKMKNYPIDGVVIKSNTDCSLEKFGSTRHHPLNAFAWKAEDEQHITTLRKINWTVGRETITPVAEFDPVEIDGTVVKEASLGNWAIIKSMNLAEGDTVLVEKRNQIIPHVASVIKHGVNTASYPTVCPCCSSKLNSRPLINTKVDVDTSDKIELYCDNPRCKGKLSANINYVFSKKCLNAKGISTSAINKLIDIGKVKCITDMFDLTVDDFKELDGFSDKKSVSTYNSIQNSRNKVPLSKFIASCGIMSIGEDIGNMLSDKYHTYENILSAITKGNIEEFTSIKGIGNTYACKLISNEFINAYKKLREYITPINSEPKVSDKESKSFVITGELSEPRKKKKKLVELNGDKMVGSVSKSTYALVTDNPDSNSSKAKKARALGIKIMSEDDLMAYLTK